MIRALLAAAILASIPSVRAAEIGFESLKGFAASTTTRSAVFEFDAPAFGTIEVELESPREDARPQRSKRRSQVAAGHNRIECSDENAALATAFSVEIAFPEYSVARSLGSFGRGEGQFVKPTHVALGPRGELFVVDTGQDRVQVFDRHLNFLFGFGTFNAGAAAIGAEVDGGRFDEPWDIVIPGNQELFVTDQRNRRVVRFDLLGRFVSELGRDANITIPRGIAADIDRDLYVCDSDADRIVVMDRDGRVRRRFGSFGWGSKQFKTPTDVAIGRDRTLYVADRGNRRVHVFDRFERPLAMLDGPFQEPENLHVDADDFLYVVDAKANRVFRYSSARQRVATYPGPGDDYELSRPTDCARAPDGTLYIVDSGHGRILALREDRRAFRRTGTFPRR